MKKSYKKSYRRKPVIPFYKKSFFLKSLGLIITSVILFYVLVFYEFFWVKDIEVLGNDSIEKELILDSVNNSINFRSIFLIKTAIISDNVLSQFPEIYLASVSRDFPDKLIVSVKERHAIAIWCNGNLENCFYVDKEGFLFKDTDSKNLVVISSNSNFGLNDTVIESEKLLALNELWQEVRELGIYWFELNGSDIVAHTTNGFVIKFISSEDLISQAKILKLTLDSEISKEDFENLEYIDVRFENRAYFKLSTPGS